VIHLFESCNVSGPYCFVALLDGGQQPGFTPPALGIVEERNSPWSCRFFLRVGRIEVRFISLTCQ
jgi:hypothetical protein